MNDERHDGDEEERVPDREREVRDPDVAVLDVRELVPDDGAERGWVCDLLHDEPAADRDAVATRMPERKASGGRVERIPEEPRRIELLLAGELGDLGHDGRRIRRRQRLQLRRRVIQSGVATMIAAAARSSAAVPPSIHHTW